MAYGETVEFGFPSAENKIYVHDLHATLMHLLGLDHKKMTHRSASRHFHLMNVAGEVVPEIVSLMSPEGRQ